MSAAGLGRLLAREVRQRAAAVEQAIDDLGDGGLWWRPAPATNAAGNLVLHLCGNLRKYVGLGLGGVPFDRDRPAEFTAGGMPAAEVGGRFRETIREVLGILESVPDTLLAEAYPGPEFAGLSRAAVALHAVEHLGYHAGQIVLLAKLRPYRSEG